MTDVALRPEAQLDPLIGEARALQRRRRLRISAVVTVVAVVAVASVELGHRGGGGRATGGSASAFAVSSEPASAGVGAALAVFDRPRTAADVLPAATLLGARGLVVGGTPSRPDRPRFGGSRLVATAGGVSFYVWPISKRGLCSGLGDGSSARCNDAGPARNGLFATLVGGDSTGLHIGAVVGSDVTGVKLDAPGLTCAVNVARSGFLCVGSRRGGPVVAHLTLRGGGTKTVRVVTTLR